MWFKIIIYLTFHVYVSLEDNLPKGIEPLMWLMHLFISGV